MTGARQGHSLHLKESTNTARLELPETLAATTNTGARQGHSLQQWCFTEALLMLYYVSNGLRTVTGAGQRRSLHLCFTDALLRLY